jgi:hypothetical protein
MNFQGSQECTLYCLSPYLFSVGTYVPLFAATALLLFVIQGCITPKRLPAVPDSLTTNAVIPGIPKARIWVHSPQGIENLLEYIVERRSVVNRELSRKGLNQGTLQSQNFLAISGGGDKGAFSAGLLVGWSETGNRPSFDVVTGISTGALIAPLVFIGPEYDQDLKTIYTNVGPKDIFKKRYLLEVLFDDALRDSTPLWNLVEDYVNEELLERIAEKYHKGRSLFVATTDLDARLPVFWNMGEIAASSDPRSLELFRKILLASASIPAVFPPVMIDVEVDGVAYQEMHVDGSASSQVFLFPASLGDILRDKGLWIDREMNAYIIRNARLDPNWSSVDRRIFSIMGRAISALIQAHGIGDLHQIYYNAKLNDMNFNLAFIGPEFDMEHKVDFDTGYMRALFDYAYQLAREGYPWQKAPPNLVNPNLAEE